MGCISAVLFTMEISASQFFKLNLPSKVLTKNGQPEKSKMSNKRREDLGNY